MKHLRLTILLVVLVIVAVIFYRQVFVVNKPAVFQSQTPTSTAPVVDSPESGLGDPILVGAADCNIAKVKISGFIDVEMTLDEGDIEDSQVVSSEKIVRKLEEINNNADYDGVLLIVNSNGGDPVASEEITNAVKRLGKPVVAVIKSIGTSGAYLVASGADYIFASKVSDIGGIGATMSYLDSSVKNRKDGLTYNALSSGKFKDTGDPDKPLTNEEKELLMRDILISHQLFMEFVAENRNMPLEKVKGLADGSTMMGEMALSNSLIDAIGGEYEAKEWLGDQLQEDINICDY